LCSQLLQEGFIGLQVHLLLLLLLLHWHVAALPAAAGRLRPGLDPGPPRLQVLLLHIDIVTDR
jgi:hypothetical protein